MADDIIFDDSPIAKYIAQVNATSRRARKNIGYKLERIDHAAVEPKKSSTDEKLVTAPLYHVNKTSSGQNWVLNYLLPNLYTVKIGTIELVGQIVTDSCRSSNSAFTGINIPSRIKNASSSLAMAYSIRTMLYFSLLIFVCPLMVIFFDFAIGFALSVVLSPAILYFQAYLYKEYRYLLNLASLLENCTAMASETQSLLLQLRGALQLIQEVELVFRGYRITPLLSPIARLEQNAQNRRCHLLRQTSHDTIFSALRLLRDQQKDVAVRHAFSMEMVSLDEDMNDMSISALKTAAQHLQISLANYWEILLVHHLNFVLEANEVWRISTDPSGSSIQRACLESLNLLQLVQFHALELKKAHSYQDAWVSPSSSETKPIKTKSSNPSVSSLQDHLNELQACLQTELARIALCKDQLQGWDANPEGALNEMIQTFSKFESDIAIQLPHAATSVSNALNRLTRELQGHPERTTTPLSNAKSFGEFESDISSSAASSSQLPITLAEELDSLIRKPVGLIQEKVYEAETGGDEEQEIKPSTISREERIALARQAREEAKQRESEVFAKLNFVLELKDVLQSRVAPSTLQQEASPS